MRRRGATHRARHSSSARAATRGRPTGGSRRGAIPHAAKLDWRERLFTAWRRTCPPALRPRSGQDARLGRLCESGRSALIGSSRCSARSVRSYPPVHGRQRPGRTRNHQRAAAQAWSDQDNRRTGGRSHAGRCRQIFDRLKDYRDGNPDALITYMAEAAVNACEASQVSATHLATLPEQWHDQVRPRRGSAAETLIDNLMGNSILDITRAESVTGASRPRTYQAIDRLHEAGVLDGDTGGGRNRIWVASDVMTSTTDPGRAHRRAV